MSLAHAISARSAIQWDTTAARYLSLNQYLPQSLGIGGIGVVIPPLATQLEEDSFEVTNAATTVNYKYLMNSRMTFSATGTGAYFLMVPSNVMSSVPNPSPNLAERFLTIGGDARITYQLTMRDTVGGAITPIYIDGIEPRRARVGGDIASHVCAGTEPNIYGEGCGGTALHPVVG